MQRESEKKGVSRKNLIFFALQSVCSIQGAHQMCIKSGWILVSEWRRKTSITKHSEQQERKILEKTFSFRQSDALFANWRQTHCDLCCMLLLLLLLLHFHFDFISHSRIDAIECNARALWCPNVIASLRESNLLFWLRIVRILSNVQSEWLAGIKCRDIGFSFCFHSLRSFVCSFICY